MRRHGRPRPVRLLAAGPADHASDSDAGSGANADHAVDAYYENAAIYTADEGDTTAEVLAVRDGKIAFVGSAADGQAYKDAAGQVWTCRARSCCPA